MNSLIQCLTSNSKVNTIVNTSRYWWNSLHQRGS